MVCQSGMKKIIKHVCNIRYIVEWVKQSSLRELGHVMIKNRDDGEGYI